MNSSAKIMYGTAAFLGVMAVIYILATKLVADDGSIPKVEWAGTVALVLAFVLAVMLGAYLHLTSNRVDILPEDWEEAEVADKAGTLGFFSPHSIWPAAMSGAVMVLGLGVAFLHWWLLILGAVLLVYTTVMLNMQYGLPKEKH